MSKPLRIFTSSLTTPPRYYASCSYSDKRIGNKVVVVINGKKWDVTEEIEAIVSQRMLEREA